MDPVDLLVAYVLLSSVLAWGAPTFVLLAIAFGGWRRRRAVAATDHQALELLAGRELPGAGNGSLSALAGFE